MAQKPVLGKGLASLLPSGPPSGAIAAGLAVPASAVVEDNRDRHPGISLAAVEEIEENPYQPRHQFNDQAIDELSQSIRENGIIQPLVVRKRAQGGYQLIAGERRLRAAKKAGLKQVPVVIRKSTDKEALELALIENIQRQDLNCIDVALAYSQLMQDFSLTQELVATRVGKDRATVANHLRLLKLPDAIQDDLKKQILSFGHGKALLSLEDQDQRLQVRARIVEKKLSVRDAEALIEEIKQSQNRAGSGSSAASEPESTLPPVTRLGAASQDLTRYWATKVEIRGTERRGKIVLHYGSRQELDRILELMQNQKR